MVGQAVDHAGHVAELVGVVQGAVEDVLVVGHAGARAPGLLGERGEEVVVHARAGDDAGGGGAVLSGVEVAGAGDALGGGLDVGVVEDDDRGLAAELEVDARQVLGGRRSDLHARADRAGDGDQLRRLVLDQRSAGVAVTGDDVEDARRQELLHHLGEQRGGRGRGVARLEDQAVPRGQCRGDLPDHHHQRVVPGRHLADDADRLPAYPGGVVLEVLPRRLALEHARGAGEESQLVDRRRQLLVDGEADRLAGVTRLHVDELPRALLERVGDLQQRLLAVRRGRVAPGLERGVGGPVGAVDVLSTGLGGGRVDLTGGRVEDVVGLPRRAVDELSVDDIAELGLRHAPSVVIRQRNR